MKSEDVRRALAELAKDDDAMPRAGFITDLEDRLRNQPPVAGDYAPSRPAPNAVRPRRARRLVPAFAALALLVGGASYAVVRDGGAGVTSIGGSSTSAPTTLDRTTTSSISSSTVPAEAATTTEPVAPTRLVPVPATEPVTTVARPDPTVTEPVPSTAAPSTRPRESTSSSTRPTSTTAAVASMRLGASRVEATDQVWLEWTAVPTAVRYIVVRTVSTTAAPPPEPVFPAVAPTEVAVEAAAPTRTATNMVPAPATMVRYRVVALDGAGRMVGKSAFVQVNLPR